MKQLHVRFGLRRCENSEVKLSRRMFVSNTLNKKRIALAEIEGAKWGGGVRRVEYEGSDHTPRTCQTQSICF